MAQYTLTLKEDAARRISDLVEILGGSVPSFAAGLASDISKLPLPEIARIRREINDLVKDYELAKKIAEKRLDQSASQTTAAN